MRRGRQRGPLLLALALAAVAVVVLLAVFGGR